MLALAAAIFLILATPGPGVLSLAGVGAAFGYRAGWMYGSGLFVGSNLVMVLAAFGLGALLEGEPALKIVFAIASCGYLIYLAWRIASAGTKIAIAAPEKAPGFWGAILLQVFNPKAYAVGTFVFSNFPILQGAQHEAGLYLWEVLLKLVILNAIWIPIHIVWFLIGVGLKNLNLAPETQNRINILMALAMLLVVGLAMASNFSGQPAVNMEK